MEVVLNYVYFQHKDKAAHIQLVAFVLKFRQNLSKSSDNTCTLSCALSRINSLSCLVQFVSTL